VIMAESAVYFAHDFSAALRSKVRRTRVEPSASRLTIAPAT
jgi:hypothetical protein